MPQLARVGFRGEGIVRLPNASVVHLSRVLLSGSGRLRGPANRRGPVVVLHANGEVTLTGGSHVGAKADPP